MQEKRPSSRDDGGPKRGVEMETGRIQANRAPCLAVLVGQALGRAPGHGGLGEVR